MDARAYLTSQGWRGEGHSLDKTGRGIKKPLLIAHKQDLLGLGKKRAAQNVSDQWWMRAFDESLKGIGTGQVSALSTVRKTGINRAGLYGFFVEGEGLAGTVSNTEASSVNGVSNTTTPPTSASEESDSASEESDSESSSDSDSDSEMSEAVEIITATPIQPVDEPQRESRKRKHTDSKGEVRKRRKDLETEKAKPQPKLMLAKKQDKASKDAPQQAQVDREKTARKLKRALKNEMAVEVILRDDILKSHKSTPEELQKNSEKEVKARKKIRSAKLEEQATRAEKKAEKQAKRVQKPAEKEAKVKKRKRLEKDIAKNAPQITAKLAKLSAVEKAQYAKRAASKNQSLEEYVLRRIEKKDEKRASKAV
ncbi:hypothetical protein GQ43DRAFT_437131 [Delitschia confertaspora ATCC 74209]|uniref:G-patch domain-containing protein n=1 Tax=Delitschia confertaspora ATCC 74209 TaxID=1513339 RepID=A0A9P4JXG2_9PLEO|nr:hypothetical protein GQ43DRAFT_437131 [Delitschia confertaspora ATCC 74209]